MNSSLSLPSFVLALVLPALGLPASAGAAGPHLAPVAGTSAQTSRMSNLVAVRASHRKDVDRMVFRFRGPLPTTRVQYVDQLEADGSGRRLRVAGQAILQVRFQSSRVHPSQGAQTATPRRRAFALPNVMTAVRAGDFEGVVTYGLGLAQRSRVRVSVQPERSRVVIRLRAGFPTVRRQVFFLDRDNVASGDAPYFVSTRRRVPAASPATGVMDRLFAGPTPGERAQGLRLLRSGATGFTDLEITDGTARVRLLGRCSSRGSTVTIAGAIFPSLRQFDSVDWVKIYDRDGATQQPTGARDSTPVCLEP